MVFSFTQGLGVLSAPVKAHGGGRRKTPWIADEHITLWDFILAPSCQAARLPDP